MGTSIFTVFTFLNFVHSFECEAVQPINSLNLSSFILIHKLFQTLHLPALLLGNLQKVEISKQIISNKSPLKQRSTSIVHIRSIITVLYANLSGSSCLNRSICLFSLPKPQFVSPCFELFFHVKKMNCSSTNQTLIFLT